MAPSTTGRSRSSTTSSFRSDSSRAPVASNETPLGGVSSQPIAVKEFSGWTAAAGDSTLASSYASQHTLKTLKGRGGDDEGGSPTSSRSSSPARGSNKLQDARRGPQFIIDLASSSSSAEDRNDATTPHGRNRSATFGGVELPPSPAAPTSSHPSTSSSSTPAAPSRRPPLARADTDEDGSFRSIPSSLHLGGGTTFAERRPMLHAGLKAGGLFLTSLLLLYVLLKTLLPPIDEEHRGMIKLPKSFDELKGLNEVLQVYKTRHYYRVLGCYTTVYLFLQAFSIPGSMYLSILGGAMYGVLMALPLVCFCVATGALLCYFISAALGPAILLNSEKWQRRIDAWTTRIDGHKENLISYLIVLRIAPLPPHWVVNVVAPHLGISIYHFWLSTFFGIAGVSYIHTTIGTTLDQMTSSEDFHLISWGNGLGLGGIIVAVLIPVALRRMWKKDLEQAAVDDVGDEEGLLAPEEDLPSSGARRAYHDEDEERAVGRERAFRLDSDSASEDEDEGEGEEGSQGAWQESRGAAGGSGGGGDMNKASRLLGVTVGKDVVGRR